MKALAVFYDADQCLQSRPARGVHQGCEDAGDEIVADELCIRRRRLQAQLTKILNTKPRPSSCPATTRGGPRLQAGQGTGPERAVPRLRWVDSVRLSRSLALAGTGTTDALLPGRTAPARQAVRRGVQGQRNGEMPDAMAILGYGAMNLMADLSTRRCWAVRTSVTL